MPLTKSKKEQILNKLRSERQSIAQKTSDAMKLITVEELSNESVVKTFRKRIHITNSKNEWRSHQYFAPYTSYTLKEKALKFDVSITAIDKVENKAKKVDPFYLEGYSLYFNVSPLYLIGKVEDPGIYDLSGFIDPWVEYNPKLKPIIEKLIMNFYKSDNGRILLNDLEILSNIDTPISRELRFEIEDFLLSSSKIKKNLIMGTSLVPILRMNGKIF